MNPTAKIFFGSSLFLVQAITDGVTFSPDGVALSSTALLLATLATVLGTAPAALRLANVIYDGGAEPDAQDWEADHRGA